jgi:Ca-activated chloride channel family protein
VAFTTKQMRESAESGTVSVMIMEYQAYSTSETLKDYVFTPLGVRHDSPLYVFEGTSGEKREALRLFTDFVKSDEVQEGAKEYGFNYEEQYTSNPPNLDGAGLIEAQKVWKENKEGGKPIIAVFVADTSGSMEGTPLSMLQASLLNSQKYIGENSYIGLVSYSDDVTIELPVGKFEGEQRGKFAGAVKNFSAAGGTATYDAVLVAIDMIREAEKEAPDARARIFVLSDGETNEGYALSKIAPVVKAYGIPVHTIGYNQAISELEDLSRINEASSTKASEADIVYSIQNIFNAQM